jgi:hypothetical protein
MEQSVALPVADHPGADRPVVVLLLELALELDCRQSPPLLVSVAPQQRKPQPRPQPI